LVFIFEKNKKGIILSTGTGWMAGFTKRSASLGGASTAEASSGQKKQLGC